MARAYPDYIVGRKKSHVESRFLERLIRELPDNYVILPSLEIAPQEGISESEADFIVLHSRGRLLLEIKGGQWKRELGAWYRLDHGQWVAEWKCPFHQCRTNSYSIRNQVREAFPKDSLEAKSLFGRAVVFPNFVATFTTGEFANEMFLDQQDLTGEGSLLHACERLFDFAEEQYRLARQKKVVEKAEKQEKRLAKTEGREAREIQPPPLESFELPATLTMEQVMNVARALRPDIKPVASLSVADLEQVLRQLSKSQLRVLDTVEKSKRLRVLGGPGSGKTLLAFESARRALADQAQAKVGLVCFNRSLGGFLADVARQEKMANVRAGSFYTHIDALLGAEKEVQAETEYYTQRVSQAIAQARQLPETEKFDVLIVDEGQDFRDSLPRLQLLDALLKGGLAKGRWRWFEDPNQYLSPPAVSQPEELLQELNEVIDDAGVTEVTGNWRNTEEIIERACAALGVAHETDDLGMHGPRVESAVYQPGKELALLEAVLAKHVSKEINDGKYAASNVVILSMRGGHKALFEGVAELGGFALEPYDVTKPASPGVVRTSSVYKFKGMESHVVILVDVDHLDDERTRRKAYVGMTRARYKLIILGAAAPLQQIFAV